MKVGHNYPMIDHYPNNYPLPSLSYFMIQGLHCTCSHCSTLKVCYSAAIIESLFVIDLFRVSLIQTAKLNPQVHQSFLVDDQSKPLKHCFAIFQSLAHSLDHH
jgi:hypothetical protein